MDDNDVDTVRNYIRMTKTSEELASTHRIASVQPLTGLLAYVVRVACFIIVWQMRKVISLSIRASATVTKAAAVGGWDLRYYHYLYPACGCILPSVHVTGAVFAAGCVGGVTGPPPSYWPPLPGPNIQSRGTFAFVHKTIAAQFTQLAAIQGRIILQNRRVSLPVTTLDTIFIFITYFNVLNRYIHFFFVF